MTYVLAFVLACAAALAAGPLVIAQLRALSLRQIAYEDAPKTHQKKTGTPTMGGVLFMLALPAAAIAFPSPQLWPLVYLVLTCALIGFADDIASVTRGRNRGLRAREKFAATLIVAIGFVVIAQRAGFPATLLGIGAIPWWMWAVLSVCVILATTHSVNLTDGLDGLASGTIVPPLLVTAFVAWRTGYGGVAAFELAVAGAVVGFLWYNRHPARVFMGDTGSLALGAALAGGAILCGAHLLLLLIGGVFAAETLSVIIQVVSFKSTGKRVFRMSPLHHHFEVGGWPETKVTTRFWLASAALSLAGLGLVARP